MFDLLPFGNLSSQARAGFAALSAHAAVIVFAIYGSEQAIPAARAVVDTVPIELPAAPIVEQASSGKNHSSLRVLPSAPAVPATPIILPSPGFAVDSNHRDSELAALRSLTERELKARSGGESEQQGPAVSRDVDQLPTLKGDLWPRYPEELRATRLSGQVEVEYVVNADGRVSPRSIRIMRSSHPAFSRAVLQALPKARFNPARIGRMPVAVLVQQSIRFEAALH
jgi:TonB family protein